MNSYEWSAMGFIHNFFPLTQGHAISECAQCHQNNSYSNTSNECISCHVEDFNKTLNPDHKEADINTDCVICHTTDPGWRPADFIDHDTKFFHIYSANT